MARASRLKPRRTWTNRLAWAVWKQRQKNKERHANGGGGDCPLTFENGILNGGRVLCSDQLLIGSSDGTPYVDSEDWIDPENWND